MVDLVMSLLVWLGIFSNLLLGVLVYKRDRKSRVNKSLAFMGGITAAWAASLFFFEHPVYFSSYVWLKIVYFLVLFLVGSIYFFSYVFPPRKIRSFAFPLIIYIPLAIPFAYTIIFTRLFVFDVVKETWGYRQILGPVYPFFGAWASSFAAWGVFNFFRSYRKARGLVKTQVRYIFLGMFLFSLMGITLDVIFPVLLKNSRFIWFSTIGGVFFIGCTTYAIVKHRLMDIRLVVARSAAYSLLVLILAFVYVGGLFFVSAYFFKQPASLINLGVPAILALIIAFSFQPLRLFLEKVTNKIFFKERYESEDLLRHLSQTMASFINLETLTHKTLKILCQEMGILKASFVIPHKKDHDGVEIAFGKNHFHLSEENLERLEKADGFLVFEELEEGRVKEMLRKKEISIFLPLKTKERLVGFLLLGEKASGDIYFEQDFEVLEILAPQFAIGLQNAQHFEEIRRFNITLKEEVKKATEKLRRAYKQLKELDRMKDEFLDVASHELRTPLTAIRGNTALLQEYFSEKLKDEKAKEMVSDINESSVRLVGIVNDFLDVSRLAGGRVEFKKEKFDLSKLIQGVIGELEKLASQKGLYLRLEKVQDHLPEVMVDKERTRQVIMNIIGNAIKYTEKGGVNVGVKRGNGFVKVKVSDTGIGIVKENQGLLFQKFQQASKRVLARDITRGTGLGLYISKKLAEGMEGKVYLERSELGKGSVFCLELPIAGDKSKRESRGK